MKKMFKVSENTVGRVGEQHRIIFNSLEDLHDAKKELDNAKDLYLVDNKNICILMASKDITNLIYDGKIVLGARIGGKEK